MIQCREMNPDRIISELFNANLCGGSRQQSFADDRKTAKVSSGVCLLPFLRLQRCQGYDESVEFIVPIFGSFPFVYGL